MEEGLLVGTMAIIPRHPWWLARAGLTLELLRRRGVRPPARVLDAGCGWGVTLDALERAGYDAVGLDVSRRTLERIDRDGRALIVADLARPLPPDAGRFGAVLALDVIEHLDDDRAALARLARLAEPGGLVVVSVPALPELFSEFDEVQGHRRRYLPERLRSAFDGTGLVIEEVLWWGAWMVPLLRRQRCRPRRRADESPSETYRRHLTIPSWPLSAGLRLAFRLDRGPTLRGRSKTGTSLFAVARRPV
jgi:SAM-dependent methyltransferase